MVNLLDINPQPLMNPEEITALHQLIRERQPRRVLEWGGGGSTLYWPVAYPGIDWVTIEHDQDWVEALRVKAAGNVTILHLGPPELYTISPAQIGKFDLIIVDCKNWRVECLRQAPKLLNKRGVVIQHDSWQPRWRPGWRFYGQPIHLVRPRKNGKRRGLVMFNKP